MAEIQSHFLDTIDAARFLGRQSPRTLERKRCDGTGPPFHKLGKRCFYTREDLLEWARKQRRTSTSDVRGDAA